MKRRFIEGLMREGRMGLNRTQIRRVLQMAVSGLQVLLANLNQNLN